jgi:AMP-polyphosphate phosphotransferase
MLEKVDLTRSLPKDEYTRRLPELQERLFALQTGCWMSGIPTVIVMEGWDAAGKGTCISRITEKIEPRGFRLHAIQAPRTHELRMPWLYRFWLRIPSYGQMALFDTSWYRRVLEERVEKIVPKSEWTKGYQDIPDFERALADDGYVFLKFFFHIDKKEQKKRFRKLEKDPLESWRVGKAEWERHKRYARYHEAAEDMLARTEAEWAPWTIVEATDRYWARIKVFETITATLDAALQKRKPAARKKSHA